MMVNLVGKEHIYFETFMFLYQHHPKDVICSITGCLQPLL